MQEHAYSFDRNMREAVKAFKVLSDDTRLRMLNVILERECCVCEVMQALQISQSKASRGLTILYDAGFLKQRKDGLWSLYSIDTEMRDYLSELTGAAKKALKDNKVAAQDRERLQKAERVGPGCVGKLGKARLSAETS